MDELEKLLAELTAHDEKIDALLQNDQLTDEQRAEHDKLVADRETLTGKIATERARLERAEERRKLADEADRLKRGLGAGGGRKTDADNPPDGDISGNQAADFRVPATVRRYGTLQHFSGTVNGQAPDVRAYRFGMWALAQLSRHMSQHYRFQEALDFYDRNAAVWATAHQSNNSTGAHNTIPTEFGTDMIIQRERYSVARRLFMQVPMTSDTRSDPREEDGLTAFFVGEGQQGTESNAKVDNVKLTAKDLMTVARISRQVNADSVVSWADYLLGAINQAFGHKEDLCAFIGDATSTYGHIMGAATKLQDVDGSGTDSYGLVTGAGNLYSELTLANFGSVVGILPQFADTPNAAWVCHKSFYHSVMVPLEEAAGGTSKSEISAGDRRPRPLFKGYPVEFSQVMPSTEANSQVCALLGDFSQGAEFGDRQQEEITFSEHATINGENVFERNQIAVRGTERFDINVFSVGTAAKAGAIVGLQTAAS